MLNINQNHSCRKLSFKGIIVNKESLANPEFSQGKDSVDATMTKLEQISEEAGIDFYIKAAQSEGFSSSRGSFNEDVLQITSSKTDSGVYDAKTHIDRVFKKPHIIGFVKIPINYCTPEIVEFAAKQLIVKPHRIYSFW